MIASVSKDVMAIKHGLVHKIAILLEEKKKKEVITRNKE
jgi:hypothetical protein